MDGSSKMLHSIIIAHRNRNATLAHTFWSIGRSAEVCGIDDFEVVVVDALSKQVPRVPPFANVVHEVEAKPGALFNKSRALNLGITAARGDILTFLDADMLVGKHWMRGVMNHLTGPDPPTRLCYRVRHLRVDSQDAENQGIIVRILDQAADKAHVLDGWFGTYGGYVRAWEGYGSPDKGGLGAVVCEPVFGNSQYSIRRADLNQLRFNEEMDGAGFEDLWMIRQIWDKYGRDYRGVILTEGDDALLHMAHPRPMIPTSDWCTPESNARNKRLYKQRWPHSEW